MLKKTTGFTLVELLVVISIIALLSTLAIVALNSARQKSRDAKRVADIKQIQTGLEMYLDGTTTKVYPTAATAITLGGTSYACLNQASGFTTANCTSPIMSFVPADPGANSYSYTSATGATYTLVFTLEGASGSLAAGAHTASPGGIQ
ncbi:MAG: prepilin-type N-terminal cleavage/methylation domain-containing protein [Candidatus Kerfeldbacteria bacterium]|nr:prepilin-type N-terminal cleavage/methylation domain-containing protein [Candidatus Kerfeldbacteria bacterium]